MFFASIAGKIRSITIWCHSLVNYHGVVLMDEFVRQRERVVDYRTEFSGIRPSDMVKGSLLPRIRFLLTTAE